MKGRGLHLGLTQGIFLSWKGVPRMEGDYYDLLHLEWNFLYFLLDHPVGLSIARLSGSNSHVMKT